jgi:hypothetical protein
MSLALALDNLSLADPIADGLRNGTIRWGDVPFDDWELDLTISLQAERYYDPDWAAKLPPPLEKPVEKPVVEQIQLPPCSNGIKTLMAKNLPRDITVEKLRSIFEPHGPIRDIYIPKNMDKSSPYFGTIKGFAKVQFLKPEDSAKAYQAEFGRLSIGSNKIVIEFAKEDR